MWVLLGPDNSRGGAYRPKRRYLAGALRGSDWEWEEEDEDKDEVH